MANPVCEVLVTETSLEGAADTAAATAEDAELDAGAVVDFLGVVRKLEDGREIDGIEYEAHREMADHQLRQIAEQAAENFRLRVVIIHHRIGFIAVGEPSLFMRVTSLHREEAFRASQWIVNELKRKVPIWKKPRFTTEKQPHAAHRAAATAR